MRSKYHSKQVCVDGVTFDSRKEYKRFRELSLMQKSGTITDLKLQVPFVLIPTQKIDGKVVERSTKYVADFTYYKDGEFIVEDTKGFRTKEYIIKRKLMLKEHGIRIKEV